MTKTIRTKKYGPVTIRNAMLVCNDNTTLVDGVVISGDEVGHIEIPDYYDILYINEESLVKLVEKFGDFI